MEKISSVQPLVSPSSRFDSSDRSKVYWTEEYQRAYHLSPLGSPGSSATSGTNVAIHGPRDIVNKVLEGNYSKIVYKKIPGS